MRVRLHRQEWSRAPLTQGFANEYAPEPIGWLRDGVGIFDHAVMYGKIGHLHRGLDFGAPMGTMLTAALGGVVVWAGWDVTGFGRLIAIQGSRYLARYGHNSRIDVELGQEVSGGQKIGLSGSSGNSSGPHIHFEVYDRHAGCFVDPLTH